MPADRVKYLLRRHSARAGFRKSGPGVLVKLRDALHNMTQEQREIALSEGWDRGLLYRAKASGKLGVRR